ncbi:alpha/beta fold hydrolase [Pseudanabaena sp. UWO311]|uniref:alpha/beta hydrolase family protein n=2 Tax=Pseudanabaena sp. UWO311 TaxID=2487337 RepID=UPI00115BA6EE|nr:alpha/beta fold hydrolase [Pseudanabaena sp. UWO311]TYQ28885.1 alpha/beta fold hydrolase [Pseudanabaena sp. UWO311]
MIFQDPNFSYNLLRTMGHTVYGGADIGECLATASRIEDGNYEQWYAEWRKTSDRLRHHADESMNNGNAISARQAYLRASNYYRNAEFFLHSNPSDPRILETWRQSESCFRNAAKLSELPIEPVEITYEKTTLPGYFYRCTLDTQPRPTIIFFPGFDSTLEELHFFGAAAAVMQGYHCLTFAGPGQGAVIRQQGLSFRPDWENVLAPVVDYLQARCDVDAQSLILFGQSFGGLLAIRAAAYDHRFSACIFHGGMFDMYESFLELFPPDLRSKIANSDDTAIDFIVGNVMESVPGAKARLGHGFYVMGTTSAAETVAKLRQFTLEDIANQVTCPTLVIDGAEDSLLPNQGQKLFDRLTCSKDYLLFSAEDGAAEHCQIGALALCHEKLFNWLKKYI